MAAERQCKTRGGQIYRGETVDAERLPPLLSSRDNYDTHDYDYDYENRWNNEANSCGPMETVQTELPSLFRQLADAVFLLVEEWKGMMEELPGDFPRPCRDSSSGSLTGCKPEYGWFAEWISNEKDFFFFFDRNFAVPKTIKLVKARAGKVSVKGLFYLRSICCRMLRLLGIRLGYVGIIVYTQSLLSTFSPLALKNRKMFNGMLAVEHA